MLNSKIVDHIIFKKDLFFESQKILKTEIKSILTNKILVKGYDRIFECSGSEGIIDKTLRLTNKNADIVLTGMNMKNINLDPAPIWHRNIKIHGAHGYKFRYSNDR